MKFNTTKIKTTTMKNIIFYLAFFFYLSTVTGQNNTEKIYINKDVSTHFISNQIIDYTDISTKNVVGDMPLKNVLRIKPIKETGDMGYITIVGEGYFIQYQLVYTQFPIDAAKRVEIKEDYEFNNPNYSITSDNIKKIATQMMKKGKTMHSVKSKKYKLNMALNNIWVIDDLFFVDYTTKNKTNIKYTIDQIRYKIVDRKKNKAETNQDLEVKPIYIYDGAKSFEKEYRNIAVFKKFTYPDDKSFLIEIAETQISGRTGYLYVPYEDFLNAKTF